MQRKGQTLLRALIKPKNLIRVAIPIRGTAPFVQHRFGAKAQELMRKKQEEGEAAKSKRDRAPKDFEALYQDAMYRTKDGWRGMPCSAFRNAMISACRICSVVMTRAKLAIFVDADGYDEVEGTPLVRITKGEPHMHIAPVRNDDGSADLRARGMWDPGWEAVPRIVFDGDMFRFDDIANLLDRVGHQVGIAEGRHDSPNSAGMGWGTFEILMDEAAGKKAVNE